jgi:hypothetical protein
VPHGESTFGAISLERRDRNSKQQLWRGCFASGRRNGDHRPLRDRDERAAVRNDKGGLVIQHGFGCLGLIPECDEHSSPEGAKCPLLPDRNAHIVRALQLCEHARHLRFTPLVESPRGLLSNLHERRIVLTILRCDSRYQYFDECSSVLHQTMPAASSVLGEGQAGEHAKSISVVAGIASAG